MFSREAAVTGVRCREQSLGAGGPQVNQPARPAAVIQPNIEHLIRGNFTVAGFGDRSGREWAPQLPGTIGNDRLSPPFG